MREDSELTNCQNMLFIEFASVLRYLGETFNKNFG